MKNKAPVSVISANYNNGLFLGEFLTSILESTILPMQVCIVDDGSTDKSVEIIHGFKKEYQKQGVELVLVALEKNKGFGFALNKAIDMVNQEFCLRVDPDDKLHKDRIKLQVEYFKSNPDCDVLGTNITYFLSGSNKTLRKSSVPLSEKEIIDTLRSGCIPIIHGSAMVRHEVFKKIKYRPDNVPAEDYDLFSRANVEGFNLANIDNVLTFVRVHDASVTNAIPYNTIRKTFILREEIWGIKFSAFNAKRRYYNQKFYRKFLFEKGIHRYAYFFLAAACWPESVIRNLKMRFNK